jgi:hypothetical protein
MSTCYIAGPMTGIPGFNYRAFDEARDILRTHGWKVISPADLDRQNLGIDFSGMTGNEDLSPWRQKFARQDMEALLKVERLFVLEGWEQSVGARNEMTMAAMLGVPICTFPGHDPVEWEAHFSNAPTPTEAPVSVTNNFFSSSDSSVTNNSLRSPEQRLRDELAAACDSTPFVASDDFELVDQWKMRLGDEVRVTDPETGGEKGTKLARFDLIPAEPLWELAEHYGRGAAKYEDRNWEKGYAWSLSYAALMRHAVAFWQGQNNDPETDSHHMAAVAFHAFALIEFWNQGLGTDDRP